MAKIQQLTDICLPILNARKDWILSKQTYPTILYVGPNEFKILEKESLEKRLFGMDIVQREEEGFSLG